MFLISDNDLRLINDYFLGDPEEIKKLMEAVAKQGQKKLNLFCLKFLNSLDPIDVSLRLLLVTDRK